MGATNRRGISSGLIGIAIIGVLIAITPVSWLERGVQRIMPLKKLQKQNTALALDASRYQQEIALLEAIIYQTKEPQLFEAERIALFAEQLASSIIEQEESDTARIAQKRLLDFSNRTQQNAIQNGVAGLDLEVTRQDWAKVRSKIFAPNSLPPTEMQSSTSRATPP